MPFVEAYAVRFAQGNLQPHHNTLGWPDMLAPGPLLQGDQDGLWLRILRAPGSTSPALNPVYLAPPGGLSLDTRFVMEVTFDLPGVTPDSGGGAAEPWAIALGVAMGSDLAGDEQANVTCQFHRGFNGVRLNTPGVDPQYGPFQRDKAVVLESPLDYRPYQGLYPLPNGQVRHLPPPRFTLRHSFCGWGAVDARHTVGCGWLTIKHQLGAPVEDHRVYSSNAMTRHFPAIPQPTAVNPPRINALGIVLATISGFGEMTVRLRTFSLAFNG